MRPAAAPSLVTLFEHQSRTYAEIFPGVSPSQRDRILETLERLNQSAGQEILHLGRRDLRAGALVGVVQAGPVSFEILPKLDASAEGGVPREKRAVQAYNYGSTPAAQRTVFNLMVMLSYAFDLPIYFQEALAGLADQKAAWTEVLIRLFAGVLHQQVHGGLAHDYIVRHETLPLLRGRWDVQRQVLRRAEAGHAFEVIYDERSADTPLNQVFRYVIELLFPLCATAASRRVLADLRRWFQPVTLLAEITPAFLDCVHFSRLEDRYLPAFRLAQLFLSGRSIQPSAGRFPARAFVFDMNMLFERFTAAFIQRHRQEILPEYWQEAVVVAQSQGLPVYLGHSGGQPAGRLRPDLLLLRPGQPVPLLVADTKYKRIATARQKQPVIAAEDLYQMTAYAVRLKCPDGLLLFPQAPGQGALRKQFDIPGAGLRLLAASINLLVPLNPPDLLVQEIKDILDQFQQE